MRTIPFTVVSLLLLVGCASGQPRQVCYDIEIRKGDAVLACPRVLVNAGQTAQLRLDDGGQAIVVDVHADGSVSGREVTDGVSVPLKDVTWATRRITPDED